MHFNESHNCITLNFISYCNDLYCYDKLAHVYIYRVYMHHTHEGFFKNDIHWDESPGPPTPSIDTQRHDYYYM